MHLTLNDLPRQGVREVRAITESDLRSLRPDPATPERKKLRYRHHALARALASGLAEGVAGTITGYTSSTISVLKADPTFKDLVKFYQTEDSKGFNEVRAQLLGVGQLMLDEMERRVTQTPDDLSMRDLVEASELLLDRSGHGPASQATHEVHIHSGLADALKSSRVNAPYPALPSPEGAAAVVDAEFEELPGTPLPSGRAGGPAASDPPASFTWDES